MPKTLSQNTLDYLVDQTQIDPFIVVEIGWTSGLATYSSSSGVPGASSNIIDISTITNQKRGDNSSNCGSVTVTFSDAGGSLLSITSGQQIEKTPASIYLGFAGMNINDWMLIYVGKVVGPAVWSESKRTVQITIEMYVEERELGYSATKDDFSDISSEAEGVPWPMIFGTCAFVPSLHIRKHTVGFLQCSIRFFQAPSFALSIPKRDIALIDNPDLYSELLDAQPVKNVMYIEHGDRFPQGQTVQILIDDIVFEGTFKGTKFTVSKRNLPKYTSLPLAARPANDPDINNWNVLWIRPDANGEYPPIINHHCYFDGLVDITTGEWYNRCIKQHGAKCWFRYPFVDPRTNFLTLMDPTHTLSRAYGITKNGMWQDVAGIIVDFKNDIKWRRNIPGKVPFGAITKQLHNLESRQNCWWQATSDTEVRLWNESDPDIYIASLVQMDEIYTIFGKRTVEGGDGKTKHIFQQIPKSYYEIQYQANFPVRNESGGADFLPTGVLFYKPLCDYDGQAWDDEIYVSGKSTIGPNIVDVIEWVMKNWTGLSIDTASFADVKSKVTFNSNFALFDKRNALKVCQEMAYLARCAIVLGEEACKIVYLPVPPIPSAYYDENTIEMEDGLVVSSTPSSDVITKLVGSWSESYRDKHRLAEAREMNTREFEHILASLVPKDSRRARADARFHVYKNNTLLYGLKVREEQCFIWDASEPVDAFLNFWGFRYSNTWKTVRLRVPFSAARLLPFDGVVIGGAVGGGMVGVVDSVEVDYKEKCVYLGIWLPVIAGSNGISSGAWPG